MILSGFLVALTFATTIGNLQVKESPLQSPFPVVEEVAEANYYIVEFNTSAYDACYDCCGKTDGITASGVKATANHTIAAPPEYPFGQQIEINGVLYTVEDRGGSIKGNKIDIFFNSHQEAVNYGRRTVEGKVLY